ncbi:MAG: glycosyltransferase family 2 protein [Acetobacter sp.]
MSNFGTFLCSENGKLFSRSLLEMTSTIEAVSLVKTLEGFYLSADGTTDNVFDIEKKIFGRAVTTDYCHIENEKTPGFIHLRTPHGYLSVNNNNDISFSKPHPYGWETFRLISKEDLEILIDLSKCSLVFEGKWNKLSPEGSSNETLKFGSINVSIDDYLTQFHQFPDEMEFFHYDDWSPSLIQIARPAIVYIIYGGGDIIRQFKYSIQSLCEFGKYRDEVIVVTDNDANYIKNICASAGAINVTIIPSIGHDRMDYVGVRVRIFASTLFNKYRPVIYTDADIIFDQDCKELLDTSLKMNHISAAVEDGHYLDKDTSNGKTLFDEKPFNFSERPEGFNAGLMLIPSGRNFRKYFQAAYTALTRYVRKNGRNSIPYYDQSLLNYIFHKIHIFSKSPITEHNQFWLEDMSEPHGAAHFWIAAFQRADKMRGYIDLLRKEKERDTSHDLTLESTPPLPRPESTKRSVNSSTLPFHTPSSSVPLTQAQPTGGTDG